MWLVTISYIPLLHGPVRIKFTHFNKFYISSPIPLQIYDPPIKQFCHLFPVLIPSILFFLFYISILFTFSQQNMFAVELSQLQLVKLRNYFLIFLCVQVKKKATLSDAWVKGGWELDNIFWKRNESLEQRSRAKRERQLIKYQ